MKALALTAALVLSSAAAQAYTTLDCVGAYKNPVVNTHFHQRVTLKVKNNQLKIINKLQKTTNTLTFSSLDRNESRKVYLSEAGEYYIAVDNRNWESSAILLGEKQEAIEGVLRNGSWNILANLKCETVPTLSRF